MWPTLLFLFSVAIHFASHDWLSVPKDVERLVKALPNAVGPYLIPHQTFNHLDFLWGVDVRRLLYDDMLEMMKQSEQISWNKEFQIEKM